MPWLRTGTVACTLNSTTVTGTGTGFVANARVGDAFLGPDGRWYEVANIASDTALSILPAYLGATLSAGAYALAPMQGYVKDSADQLRTLVNKFGTLAAAASINALAAQTGAANKLAYFTAADQMALADFPAQARTLIAATTQALQRTALGLGSAAVAPIVGTVSDTGGVPSGAIIESGSLNGCYYTKYADGSLVQRKQVTFGGGTAAQGSVTKSLNVDLGPFAYTFVGDYEMLGYGISASSGGGWAGQQVFGSASAWGAWAAYHSLTVTGNIILAVFAFGRWKA